MTASTSTGSVGFGRSSVSAFTYPREQQSTKTPGERFGRLAASLTNDQTAAALGLAVASRESIFQKAADRFGGTSVRHLAGAVVDRKLAKRNGAAAVEVAGQPVSMASRIWQNNTFKPFKDMAEGKNIGSGIVHSLGLGLLGLDTALTTRDGYQVAKARAESDPTVNVKLETTKTLGKTLFKNTLTWFAGGAGFAVASTALPALAVAGVSVSGIVGAVGASIVVSHVLDNLIHDPTPVSQGAPVNTQNALTLPEEDQPLISGMQAQSA